MTDRQQDCSETFLDDEAFVELEKAGKVKLSISHRAELNDAISYCVRLRDWQEAYSPDALKARARVGELARGLKKEIEALAGGARLSVLLSDDEGFTHFMVPHLSSSDPNEFLDQLDAIIERCELKVPDGYVRRSSRPKDSHLLNLCSDVTNIYERAGGKAGIGGDRTSTFADFIRCLNGRIPKGYSGGSGGQLVKKAQEALKRRKKQRERAIRATAGH